MTTSGWKAVFWAVVGSFWLCSLYVEAQEANLRIRNDSGEPVAVSWRNVRTREAVFMFDLPEGGMKNLNSFAGHEFVIDQRGGGCEADRSCAQGLFRVGTNPSQDVLINLDFEPIAVDDLDNIKTTIAEALDPSEQMQNCRDRAKAKLSQNGAERKSVMAQYYKCIRRGLAPKLDGQKSEVVFERDLRENAAGSMENFTCFEPELDTTPDVDLREWTSEKDGKTRPVHIKLDRPTSRIHVVEDFAYPEECDAMAASAEPKLHRASTADGKGGTEVSLARKALQAGITPSWKKEEGGDLVTRLSRRVYDYVNHVLQMNITEHGQEPLMSIQYFGHGYNDTTPDRYTPHCDGPCEGKPHKYGSRIATMVIYCTIPEKGGHTNFQNANVHVKPQVGSAVFFSYVDPVTKKTDHRLTQHSGCPVFEGEKKIITQWVRYGVSSDTPHSAFNTLGVLRREDGDVW